MTVDEALTTTRAVRKRLDVIRPVRRDVALEHPLEHVVAIQPSRRAVRSNFASATRKSKSSTCVWILSSRTSKNSPWMFS